MEKRQPRYTISDTVRDFLPVAEIRRLLDGWLLVGDIDQHSSSTLTTRRILTDKLLWFLRAKGFEVCDLHALRAFLHYVANGHKEEGGRWGNPHMTRPVRPRTVKDYHMHLRTFFRWLVAEDVLDVSPVERIPVPISRADQVKPFTEAEIDALLAASKRTKHPRRDEAILLLLFDTGLRASEVCGLTIGDIDLKGRCATVLGKGNKRRVVYFGKRTVAALWNLLKDRELEADEPLFLADRGVSAGEPLTRNGLFQLIERLGKAAKVDGAHPHRFRHSFAVTFLRNGGNQFTLQQLLGHTSVTMTGRYVALAQADLANQHRQYSPADRLRGRSK